MNNSEKHEVISLIVEIHLVTLQIHIYIYIYILLILNFYLNVHVFSMNVKRF